MVRTRDFILCAVAVLFLLVAIAGTVTFDLRSGGQVVSEPIALLEPPETSVAAVPDSDESQASVIARLREKLADGKGVVISAPVVAPTEEEVVESVVSSNTPVLCENSTGLIQRLQSWPSSGVSIEGTTVVRSVIHTYDQEQMVGSSTVLIATTTRILALPVNQSIAATPVCIEGGVIGVTPAGELLQNRSVSSYTDFNQYSLVGYAFDGLPIYGPLADSAELDQCGGMVTPAGYQYHVRPDDDFLLNCYAATPAQPSL